MKILAFVWPDERIEHIAVHHVNPEEVEDVCFGQSLVLRAPSDGTNRVYYVLGQTSAGRYLFCVVIHFPDGNGYPVTARPMTRKNVATAKGKRYEYNATSTTDSITALAQFWDTHDVTDFLDELEEVTPPVFERTSDDDAIVSIRLPHEDLALLEQLARARGVGLAVLLREWIHEKLQAA